jgi:hypothetical protein
LGGVLDIASGKELAGVHDSLKGSLDNILGRLPSKSRGIRRRPTGSAQAGAAGSYVIDLGSPSPDKIWWVIECLVTGVDDRTAPAGTNPVNTAAPAAGAESITVVPAGQTWSLAGFTATLTTSATVANRTVNFVIDDGAGHIIWQGAAAVVQTATQVVTYQGNAGVPAGAAVVGGILQMPFPASMVMQPGWRIRTLTTNIQAGDQWSAAVVSMNTVTASCVAALYVGNPARQVGANVADLPVLGNLVRPGIAVPGSFQFSGEKYPVHDSDNLFVVVYTATATAFYSATATVVELNSGAVLTDGLT